MVEVVKSPENMTSNTAPSPYVASAYGEQVGYEAYRCFDGTYTLAEGWRGTSLPGGPWWIKIYMGSTGGFVATKGVMIIDTEGGSSRPKDYTWQGSNDDSSYTTLATVTSQTNAAGTYTATFTGNTTSYKYYKVNVTANNGATAVYIEGLKVYGEQSTADAGNIKLKQGVIIC